MENVKKRCLALLLPQHEQKGFGKLEHPQQQEQPTANLNYESVGFTKKAESLAAKETFEGEAKLIAANEEKRAANHLEDVVEADEQGHVEWLALLHKLRSNIKNQPQVERKYPKQNKQRDDMQVKLR